MRFNTAFPVLLLALLVAACSPGPLAPTWHVDPETSARAVGSESGRDRLSVVTADAVPMPESAQSCGFSKQSPGVVLAMRPGVGARMRLRYWATGERDLERSYAVPSAVSFDLPLRLVPPDGSLRPEEEQLLDTFLVTNRLNPGPTRDAALAIERHRPALWNAFVRTLCMEFVKSGLEDGARTRKVASVKADIRALGRAIPRGPDRDAFARAYVGPGKESGSLAGLSLEPQRNSPTSATGGVAKPNSGSQFYQADSNLRIALLADVTLFAYRWGDPALVDWSLRDWEYSGICILPDQAVLPRISSVTIGGAVVDISAHSDQATHDVRRALGAGYAFDVVARHDRERSLFSRPVIFRHDLGALSVNDVTSVRWSAPDSEGVEHEVSPPACTSW
jgi:hypothetical protein